MNHFLICTFRFPHCGGNRLLCSCSGGLQDEQTLPLSWTKCAGCAVGKCCLVVPWNFKFKWGNSKASIVGKHWRKRQTGFSSGRHACGGIQPVSVMECTKKKDKLVFRGENPCGYFLEMTMVYQDIICRAWVDKWFWRVINGITLPAIHPKKSSENTPRRLRSIRLKMHNQSDTPMFCGSRL